MRMTAKAAAAADNPNPTPAGGYVVGERVSVHAMGTWYAGEVVKIGRTKVVVRYTSGSGTTRDKACDPNLVKRA